MFIRRKKIQRHLNDLRVERDSFTNHIYWSNNKNEISFLEKERTALIQKIKTIKEILNLKS